MPIFLDSADIGEIKRAAEWSFLAGITCNPSLVSKALKKNKISRKDFISHLEKIFALTNDRIFVQTNYWEDHAMLEEADTLFSIFSDRIVIKVPFCEEGIKASRRMKDRGMAVAMTAIFSPLQAYLSASSGVDFVVPYCNRMGRVGQDGVEMVSKCVALISSKEFPTQVMAASIISQTQVLQLLDKGTPHMTLPFSLLEEIIAHPLCWEAAELFSHDLHVEAPGAK